MSGTDAISVSFWLVIIRLEMAELAQGTDSLFPNEKTLSAIKRLNEGEGEQFASSDEMFARLDSL